LKNELEKYANSIKESNADYASIYTYFVDYIDNIAYKDEYTLEEFLINEFSKSDIVRSCAYYFEKSNATSISAIIKYLNSITKFYTEYMKPKGYDNTNLFAILPFAQLKFDVDILIKDKKPLQKEVKPPITNDDFQIICHYLNNVSKPSLVHKQISIILKLIMLYGLKLERIVFMEKSDFDSRQRLLFLNIGNDKKIILELPYSLTLEIEDYISTTENNSQYMFLNSMNKIITPAFLTAKFTKIKELVPNLKTGYNRFTSTGLAKYGIINMLYAGMNVPVIKIISGMEDDVINDCTRVVYELDNQIDLNRYINSTVRSVKSYDEIGIPLYVKY
jgi:integrase